MTVEGQLGSAEPGENGASEGVPQRSGLFPKKSGARGCPKSIFNAYDVGPYAAGPYEVDVSYDKLKPILRPDGPIAR